MNNFNIAFRRKQGKDKAWKEDYKKKLQSLY